MIDLERDATRIRLVRDRGQWFIHVSAADELFDAEIWRAFLDGTTPPVEIVVPFAEQARWLLENLSRIEAMSDLTKEQLAALDGLRSRRFAARMGAAAWQLLKAE